MTFSEIISSMANSPHHVEIPPLLWPQVRKIRNKRERRRIAKAMKRGGVREFGPNPENPPEPLTIHKLINIRALFDHFPE